MRDWWAVECAENMREHVTINITSHPHRNRCELFFYPKSTFISVSRLTRFNRLMAGFILTNAVDSPEFDHTILMWLCGMKHCWFFIFVFVFRVCFGFEEYTNFNNSTIQQSTNTKHRLFQLFTFTEQLSRRVLLLHTKWLSFYFNLFSTCLWSCSKFAQKTLSSGLETLKFDVIFSFFTWEYNSIDS